jgi:hypothetical protein
MTVDALTTDGQRFKLVAGEQVEMTVTQAIDLVRVGLITIFDDRLMADVAGRDGERAVLSQVQHRKAAA